MTEAFGERPFPRGPLFGAVALIVAAVLLVAWVRVTGIGAAHVPDAASIATRELRFADQPDGSIAVYDADKGDLVDVITGANGFLRGTLRGLARERKRESMGQEKPFLLSARADGRLTLEDQATGRRVDLESFGPTNAATFARLLERKGTKP